MESLELILIEGQYIYGTTEKENRAPRCHETGVFYKWVSSCQNDHPIPSISYLQGEGVRLCEILCGGGGGHCPVLLAGIEGRKKLLPLSPLINACFLPPSNCSYINTKLTHNRHFPLHSIFFIFVVASSNKKMQIVLFTIHLLLTHEKKQKVLYYET